MNENDYHSKLERAMWELHEKGVRRKQSHPLLFKLLRLLRFKVRLPHYSEPRVVFVYCSLYISALVAVLLWFVRKETAGMSTPSLLVTSLTVGCLFGLFMMLLNTHNKKKYDLTPWEDI